jgi:hypothetical protein
MPTMRELVEDAEGSDYSKPLYIYEFGQPDRARKFYEGDGPYANNKMGIGYMAVGGSRGTVFVVAPNYTGEELFAWLRVNQ